MSVRAFDTAHILTSLFVCLVPLLAFDSDAVVVLVCTLASVVGAAIASMACRWWPGLAASGWRLWLAAWLFNPIVILALFYVLTQYECLLGQSRGWQCMGLALVIIAAPLSLLPPTVAVVFHVIMRRAERAAAG